jgi:RNA polymerase sigma-70 factor, ECF subfamily
VAAEKIPELDRWVELAQKGDSSAFAQIYDALVKPIYRYIVYRVDDNLVAEDLTEETFLKVWQNLDKYKKGASPFSSWAYRIAHNLVIDHYRKHQPTDEIDESIPDPQDSNSPAKLTNLKLTQVRLRKIIRKLPDNYQQVIVLRYINEMDHEGIAEVMGKTEGAVRTLQSRALDHLRDLLKDEKLDM